MQITFTKGQREDWIAIVRDDGSRAETRFPLKGPVPHDAVHLFVEAGLGLTRGFWGMIGSGVHPGELLEIAKAAGHASASRAREPGAHIAELLQAERLVEVFEADLWSGSHATLRGCSNWDGRLAAIRMSRCPVRRMARSKLSSWRLPTSRTAGLPRPPVTSPNSAGPCPLLDADRMVVALLCPSWLNAAGSLVSGGEKRCGK